MTENVEAPASGGAKKATEVVKAVVQTTGVYAKEGVKIVRKGSGLIREEVPLLKSHAREFLDNLQNLEALQLRKHTDVPTFGMLFGELAKTYDAANPDLKALSVPAVGGAAVIALRLIAAIDACITQILEEAFYPKAFIGRAAFVGMAVPGYVAAALYVRKLGKKADEGEPLDLSAGARCLPPAFWVMAVASGTVTITALKEITNKIVRRVFDIRLRTLILAAAISVGLQHPAVHQRYLAVSQRIPQGLAQRIEDFWVKFQAGTRSMARKSRPFIESVFEKAETNLNLPRGSFPRASIMELPQDSRAGNVGNLEEMDGPLFTGPTGES